MRIIRQMMTGVAVLAMAGTLHAQQAVPENLLPDAPQEDESVAVTVDRKVSRENFDAAFPDMVSVPVVQGQFKLDSAPLLQNWSVENARALIAIVENIGTEGLDPADYDAAGLHDLIVRGPSEELDQLASRNFVWLIEDLRDGRTPMEARRQWFVNDPDRNRFITGDVMAGALASGDLEAALAELSPTHPDYAVLRAALAETTEEEADRRKLIRANMDRWRWLARDLGKQYLITNVPEFQLRLTVNDKIISTYRTIVGKPGRTATPQLAETVEGVIFNPTWTVPQSIVVGEGLGKKVLNNPAWARQKGYRATVAESGRITVVQQPGPTNSLGRVKLDMPNSHAIFLHDTPSRHLFGNDNRALSHGCIRTERALELAITLAILGKGASKDEAVEIATSGKYTQVPFKRKMPVYITYFTMASDINGELATFDDIYERDLPVLASLEKPRGANRRVQSNEEVIVIVDDPRV